MKKQVLLLCIMFLCESIVAQKVINNPNYIGKNFLANVTKVEVKDAETILHFTIKTSRGFSFSIPTGTYIEDAGINGQRLFVLKAEGIKIGGWNKVRGQEVLNYKLYFPPLAYGVHSINYGEANYHGSWYIYKLSISDNRNNFFNSLEKKIISTNANKGLDEDIIMPKELPTDFFGNWYDKYGTLILIATPEYMVADSRIHYYRDIRKYGEKTISIKTSAGSFEIINLNKEGLTLRTDRLMTLIKRKGENVVPESLKGFWVHIANIKKIKITDTYFYNDDTGLNGVDEVIKSRIDYVANSKDSSLFWLILYRSGKYNMYIARKVGNKYVLTPRGYPGATYQKIKY